MCPDRAGILIGSDVDPFLIGRFQYQGCLAYVTLLMTFIHKITDADYLVRVRMDNVYSRCTRSYLRPTPPSRVVSVSAQPSDTPPPVLSSVRNAVRSTHLLRWIDTEIQKDCGDVEDVGKTSPGLAAESDCNIACTGDPIHLCGGENRLQVRDMYLNEGYRSEANLRAVLQVERDHERLEEAHKHWPL